MVVKPETVLDWQLWLVNIPSTLRIKHLAQLPSQRMGDPEAAAAVSWPVATAAL